MLLTINTQIRAHDFWLEPEPFYQENNQQIDISIRVGENLKGDALPNIPAWYSKFDVITPEGLKEVDGELGSDPAGYFKSDTDGTYAIGYLSTETEANLNAKKFNTYLKTQGLDKIITQREALNENDKSGREIFYRNVKTLIKIGKKNNVDFSSYDFGHPLNIKPLKNPYELKQGEELPVQITFDQKPAAHLLLRAQIKDNKKFLFSVRSDEQGKASIPLSHKGVWLIHTVDMIRSTREDIDWESYWGSLTFELK